MRKTTKTIEKLKVTIKRPNGQIETVYKTDSVRFLGTVLAAQETCIKATREAGKGEILSFEIIEEQVPATLEEQREYLIWDLSGLLDAQDAARDRDYDNDIGFLESVTFDARIVAARQELADFDAANPGVVAEINRVEAIRTERSIQSALNA